MQLLRLAITCFVFLIEVRHFEWFAESVKVTQ